MSALRDLSFEQFIDFQFGPAIRAHGNPWYFDLDRDEWEPEPRTGIAYLTRLFANGPEVLQRFSRYRRACLDGRSNYASGSARRGMAGCRPVLR